MGIIKKFEKKIDQAKGEQGKKEEVDNAFVLPTITTIVVYK
jgi:hypothetical protein